MNGPRLRLTSTEAGPRCDRDMAVRCVGRVTGPGAEHCNVTDPNDPAATSSAIDAMPANVRAILRSVAEGKRCGTPSRGSEGTMRPV